LENLLINGKHVRFKIYDNFSNYNFITLLLGIEKYGANHQLTLLCHKIASDELEKKISLNANDKLISDIRHRHIIPSPSYEITIKDIENEKKLKKFIEDALNEFKKNKYERGSTVLSSEVNLLSSEVNLLNSIELENKKYEVGKSVLTEMHFTILDKYFQSKTSKFEIILNPNFKPLDSGITDKYKEKWNGLLSEWAKKISLRKIKDCGKKTKEVTDDLFSPDFLQLVNDFRAYFEKDVDEIAEQYKKLLSMSNEILPFDTDKAARRSLAKIVYTVTYEKAVVKYSSKAVVPKFCWWVCTNELNIVQLESTLSS